VALLIAPVSAASRLKGVTPVVDVPESEQEVMTRRAIKALASRPALLREYINELLRSFWDDETSLKVP
jgi:hypothetical protein